MPSTMKEASKGKNSTRTREPNRAISVSIPLTELLEVYQDFKIEMNEKNKAYAFILSMGLGDKYKEFSDSLPTAVDTFELCTKLLSTENL